MKHIHLIVLLFPLLAGFISCRKAVPDITIRSLLGEMTNLERLTRLSEIHYKALQFSSYDRRSKSAADSLWFANEDGFGGEPLPGFEKTLVEPDSSGTGEYLICDIRQPGVIQRLWTAAISGKIRLYLDDDQIPVYEGNAIDFFRKPVEMLAGIDDSACYSQIFRQFDASYLPVPFAKSCRIEWIGNIMEPHFYHVGIRLYESGTQVGAFSKTDFGKCIPELKELKMKYENPDSVNKVENETIKSIDTEIAAGNSKQLFDLQKSGAIDFFRVKVSAGNPENILRQSILKMYFDDTEIPQVEAPLGDFFGAAPGLNPYHSLAFSVFPDTSMVCRFIMPFKNSVRIEAENRSGETLKLGLNIGTREYDWKDGESMHFRARWKMAHELTAGNTGAGIADMSYLKAKGSGRFVGAATFLYNPSNVPTSWGNWWGEGDEKIFVDNDVFPSFFGTGSEDYYNYSWSSPMIFSHAYCGQPRNDGPGNRGYVSDFRWHIADDIPFHNKFEFYMELRHHGKVPHFSYGSIVYYYALPATTDGFREINSGDIRVLPYFMWSPVPYLGCDGYRFFQAEKLVERNENLQIEKGNLYAEESILSWSPKRAADKLVFYIPSAGKTEKTRIGYTLAHSPDGGIISFFLNGKPVKFDQKENINLAVSYRTILDNHFSEKVDLKNGINKLEVHMPGTDGNKKAKFDFIWLKTLTK